MSRKTDSGRIDLAEVFRRVQTEMKAHLSVSNLHEHGITQGTASEQDWMQLFDLYLPKRYRCSPVFVVNADGRRSRQIDLAIIDTFSSPLIFPRQSVLYVPVESVYAIFEVKSLIDGIMIQDAGMKAASVRELREDDGRPILAGLLAPTTRWSRRAFSATLAGNLDGLPEQHKFDLGCVLDCASFESGARLVVSRRDEALVFFLMRLVDLMHYAREVRSFQRCRPAKKAKLSRVPKQKPDHDRK